MSEETNSVSFEQALFNAIASMPFVTLSKHDVHLMYVDPKTLLKVVEDKARNRVQLELDAKGALRVQQVRINGSWFLPMVGRRKTPEELGITRDRGNLDELAQINPVVDVYIRANDPIFISSVATKATGHAIDKKKGELGQRYKSAVGRELRQMLRAHGAR